MSSKEERTGRWEPEAAPASGGHLTPDPAQSEPWDPLVAPLLSELDTEERERREREVAGELDPLPLEEKLDLSGRSAGSPREKDLGRDPVWPSEVETPGQQDAAPGAQPGDGFRRGSTPESRRGGAGADPANDPGRGSSRYPADTGARSSSELPPRVRADDYGKKPGPFTTAGAGDRGSAASPNTGSNPLNTSAIDSGPRSEQGARSDPRGRDLGFRDDNPFFSEQGSRSTRSGADPSLRGPAGAPSDFPHRSGRGAGIDDLTREGESSRSDSGIQYGSTQSLDQGIRPADRLGGSAPLLPPQEEPYGQPRRQDVPRSTSARTQATRRRRSIRRVRRTIRHVDPLSVLKLSLFYYACFLVVWLLLAALFYGILSSMGLFRAIEDLSSGFALDTKLDITLVFIEKWVLFLGLILMIVGSLINVFLAFLYNVGADLVGGVEMTFIEKDF